jgi:hypothetical protein
MNGPKERVMVMPRAHGGVEGWRSGETGDAKKNARLGEVSADASALGATVLISAI